MFEFLKKNKFIMKKISFLLIVFSLLSSFSFSQNKLPKFSSGVLINQYFAYNFFTGTDASKFQTTPKAFGSGISDFSMVLSPFNFWISRPIKRNIGLLTTVGFDFAKYRFDDNLYFDTDNSKIETDTISSHFYNPDFFNNQGTKLAIAKLYVPLIVYLPLSHWFKNGDESIGLFAGVIYRTYLFSYHKQIYTEFDRRIEVLSPNNLISKYFSKNDMTVKAGLKIKSIIVFGQYTINSFFNSQLPYKINEAKIGVNFSFDFSSTLQNIEDKNPFGKDFGTDAK